jgi:hypothetical protein
MCNKKVRRKMIFTAAAVCGFPYSMAHACSVWDVPGLSIDDPLPVMMIDGADRNSNVRVKVRVDYPKKSGFDFGFVSDGLYTPVTGKSRVRGSYAFAGGTVVDFALRNWGTDHRFGTADDLVYRLSDGANYAEQHYSAFPKPSESRHPKLMIPGDFRELRLDWDLDRDGKTDVKTWIDVKRGRYDAMAPAAAPVPVPSTMWLFGSGLLALGAALKRRSGF